MPQRLPSQTGSAWKRSHHLPMSDRRVHQGIRTLYLDKLKGLITESTFLALSSDFAAEKNA